MSHLQITIIGAGISGLVLGRCLLQRGVRATIFEKARQSGNRNSYGITLHQHAYRPLLKLLEMDDVAFRRRVAVDSAVGGMGKIRAGDEDGTSFRANRNRFEALLAEGLDVRWEREVQSIEKGKIVIGGEEMESEVVIGADGPHSLVRKTIAPEVDFEILPFAVYNGKRKFKPKDLGSAFEEGNNVLEKRIGDALLQISVNEKTEEEVSVSYVYSRPARKGQEEDALFRPGREKKAAKEMPEALFEEVGSLREGLEGVFKTVFDPEKMKGDRLLNWLMRTVEVERETLDEAAEQRGIVLMGDAVHAEPILGGEGANAAIADGMRLAECLLDNESLGLKGFYESRYGGWKKGIDVSKLRIQNMHDASAKPSL